MVILNQSTLNATHLGVFRLELNSILNFFEPVVLSVSALKKVQPLIQRRPAMNNARLERMLRDWAINGRSSILLLQAGTRAQQQATELAADVVNHLRRNGQYVFWNISSGRSARKMTTKDVFKAVIFQALQQADATFENMGEQLHLQKIHGTHTDREWVDLICLLFARLSKAFLIIETENMRNMYRQDQLWADQFFEFVKVIVDRTAAKGCQLKVLLILYDNQSSAASSAPPSPSLRVITIQPQSLIPSRLKHVACQPSFNTKGWKLGGRKPQNRRIL